MIPISWSKNLYTYKKPQKKLEITGKQICIFHLILLDIPPNFIFLFVVLQTFCQILFQGLSLSGQINENLLFLVKLYRIKKPNILGAVKWNFDICRYVVIRRTDTFFFFMQTLCNCSFPANYFLIVRCSWYHTNLYFGYANNQQFY